MNFSCGLDGDTTEKFVGMYVNDLTVDMGDRGVTAVRRFLEDGKERGLLSSARVDFGQARPVPCR